MPTLGVKDIKVRHSRSTCKFGIVACAIIVVLAARYWPAGGPREVRGAAVPGAPSSQPMIPEVDDKAGAVLNGSVGVGTWESQAEFKDILVTSGGKTLLKPDFAKGLDGWQKGKGQWSTASGILTQSDAAFRAVDGRVTSGESTWNNYTYTLKARSTDGNEGFHVIFAAHTEALYRWNIGGWANTRTAVQKVTSGAALEIPGVLVAVREIPGTVVDLRVEKKKWYDIKIVLHGNTADCYLDGKLISRVSQDKGYSSLPDMGPARMPPPVAQAPTPIPETIYTSPTFAGVTFPQPILDDVFKHDPISLKTAGHTPQEAFDMLGKAVDVTFTPGPDRTARLNESRTVWESKAFDKLNFDLEKMNFWQSALKIGDAAKLLPNGSPRMMKIDPITTTTGSQGERY